MSKAEVRERPILFSGPMVKAILDGRKTQTRRVIRGVPDGITEVHLWGRLDPAASEPGLWGFWGCEGLDIHQPHNCYDFETLCPHGVPGDLLWVRETHCVQSAGYPDGRGRHVIYRADDGAAPVGLWTPGIHMYRWASRLTLRVLDVRVQRLQEISDEDARAEGVAPLQMDAGSYAPRFEGAWDSINGKRPGCAWSENPWVWAITFEREPAP